MLSRFFTFVCDRVCWVGRTVAQLVGLVDVRGDLFVEVPK